MKDEKLEEILEGSMYVQRIKRELQRLKDLQFWKKRNGSDFSSKDTQNSPTHLFSWFTEQCLWRYKVISSLPASIDWIAQVSENRRDPWPQITMLLNTNDAKYIIRYWKNTEHSLHLTQIRKGHFIIILSLTKIVIRVNKSYENWFETN
jgi:hypothetical protein